MRVIICLVGAMLLLTGCSAEEEVRDKTTEVTQERSVDVLDYHLKTSQSQVDTGEGFTRVGTDITLVNYPYGDGNYCLEAYFNENDSFKRNYSSSTQQFNDGSCSQMEVVHNSFSSYMVR